MSTTVQIYNGKKKKIIKIKQQCAHAEKKCIQTKQNAKKKNNFHTAL